MRCPQRMVPGADEWKADSDGHRRCSYCGSLHPDDVIARLTAGEPATPTDKNYKMYLGEYQKVYFAHFEREHMQAFLDLFNKRPSPEGMQIAEPGYFYRLPFFMTFAEPV